MPEKKTRKAAKKAKRQGKSPSTQAGAYVHEEIEHVRKGKHGAKNPQQAIAIGLSKARRDGVDIPDKSTKKKSTSSVTKSKGLKKKTPSPASHRALSMAAKRAAKKRTPAQRSASAKKAARTRQSRAA